DNEHARWAMIRDREIRRCSGALLLVPARDHASLPRVDARYATQALPRYTGEPKTKPCDLWRDLAACFWHFWCFEDFARRGEEDLASFSVHPEDGRRGVPSDPREREAGSGGAPAAAGCNAGLPLLFLELPDLAPRRGGDRGTDACSRIQEIRSEGRSRASVSAYVGH